MVGSKSWMKTTRIAGGGGGSVETKSRGVDPNYPTLLSSCIPSSSAQRGWGARARRAEAAAPLFMDPPATRRGLVMPLVIMNSEQRRTKESPSSGLARNVQIVEIPFSVTLSKLPPPRG